MKPSRRGYNNNNDSTTSNTTNNSSVSSHLCGLVLIIVVSLGIAPDLTLPWQLPGQQQDVVSSCTTNEQVLFYDKFDRQGIIKEAHSISGSLDQHWWLSSGGYLYLNNGTASTIQGTLPQNDTFRINYSLSKGSKDTDNGYRPQNIFRLVNRNTWAGNYTAEVYFKYSKYNNNTIGIAAAIDKKLGADNGVSLMVNNQNGNNLYYVGLRADGFAGIKKKMDSDYSVLQNPVKVFPGVYKHYDNLIPQDKWIGLRAVVEQRHDAPSGKDQIYIAMYIDEKGDGSSWKYVTSYVDQNSSTSPIFKQGHTGIRTDFMDTQFKNFKVIPTQNTLCV
jgi:hypothetical protein